MTEAEWDRIFTYALAFVVFGVLLAIHVWGSRELFDISLAWIASCALARLDNAQ